MEPQITFTDIIPYPDADDGITIPVILNSGQINREARAKVDTGAAVCLFSREIGEQLKLDIESGFPITLGSITFGSLEAYGHEVTLRTGSAVLYGVVYFAKNYGLPRNFLGRRGWLRSLKVGFVDYESLLYQRSYKQ